MSHSDASIPKAASLDWRPVPPALSPSAARMRPLGLSWSPEAAVQSTVQAVAQPRGLAEEQAPEMHAPAHGGAARDGSPCKSRAGREDDEALRYGSFRSAPVDPRWIYDRGGAPVLAPLEPEVLLAREAGTVRRLRTAFGNDRLWLSDAVPLLLALARHVQALPRAPRGVFSEASGLFSMSLQTACGALERLDARVFSSTLSPPERAEREGAIRVGVFAAALFLDLDALADLEVRAVKGVKADEEADMPEGAGPSILRWEPAAEPLYDFSERARRTGRTLELLWRRPAAVLVTGAAGSDEPCGTSGSDGLAKFAGYKGGMGTSGLSDELSEGFTTPGVGESTQAINGNAALSGLMERFAPGSDDPHAAPMGAYPVQSSSPVGECSRFEAAALRRSARLAAPSPWFGGTAALHYLAALMPGSVLSHLALADGVYAALQQTVAKSVTLSSLGRLFTECVVRARVRVLSERERETALRDAALPILSGWGPLLRYLAADLLLKGDWVVNAPLLSVPHGRFGVGPGTDPGDPQTNIPTLPIGGANGAAGMGESGDDGRLTGHLYWAEDGIYVLWPEGAWPLLARLRSDWPEVEAPDDPELLAAVFVEEGLAAPGPAGRAEVEIELPPELGRAFGRVEGRRGSSGSGGGEKRSALRLQGFERILQAFVNRRLAEAAAGRDAWSGGRGMKAAPKMLPGVLSAVLRERRRTCEALMRRNAAANAAHPSNTTNAANIANAMSSDVPNTRMPSMLSDAAMAPECFLWRTAFPASAPKDIVELLENAFTALNATANPAAMRTPKGVALEEEFFPPGALRKRLLHLARSGLVLVDAAGSPVGPLVRVHESASGEWSDAGGRGGDAGRPLYGVVVPACWVRPRTVWRMPQGTAEHDALWPEVRYRSTTEQRPFKKP